MRRISVGCVQSLLSLYQISLIYRDGVDRDLIRMKQLISSWQTCFSVSFIISVALLLFLCAKYVFKYCRRIRRQLKSGSEEVILPFQYSSKTTTSVLQKCPSDHILLPELIPPTTTSNEEYGEQRKQEEVLLAENNVCFQDLPSDVLLHIMSFLPLASIGPLVRVCKWWSDVLRDPQNMNLFLGRKPLGRPNHNPIYLFGERKLTCHYSDLYVLDSMKNSNYHFSKVDFGKQIFIVADCSGFICYRTIESATTYFVGNPLTREFVELPELPDVGQAKVNLMFGLGIDLTCKKSSKLVRMICKFPENSWDQIPKEYHDTQCDVYTFGSNSWRSIGVSKFRPRFHAVLHNWMLYWTVSANPSSSITPILALDLESEKFSLVSPPDKKKGQKPSVPYLVNLGDELGCIDQCEGETRVYVVEDDATMVWSLRYCLTSTTRWMCHGLWINDALFAKDSQGIYYRDPHGMKFQEICFPGGWAQYNICKFIVGRYFPNLISPRIFWSK